MWVVNLQPACWQVHPSQSIARQVPTPGTGTTGCACRCPCPEHSWGLSNSHRTVSGCISPPCPVPIVTPISHCESLAQHTSAAARVVQSHPTTGATHGPLPLPVVVYVAPPHTRSSMPDLPHNTFIPLAVQQPLSSMAGPQPTRSSASLLSQQSSDASSVGSHMTAAVYTAHLNHTQDDP